MFTHMNVGTLLALGFPDTGDYYRRGYMPEFTVANFFILHYLLVQILKSTLFIESCVVNALGR